MNKSLSTAPGKGVPRSAALAVQEEDTVPAQKESPALKGSIKEEYDPVTGILYRLNNAGVRKFANRPIMQNPLGDARKYQLTAPITAVFKLDSKEDLEAYNKLYEKTFPSDAPEILIVEDRKEFYKGNFVCLVTYTRVWYTIAD